MATTVKRERITESGFEALEAWLDAWVDESDPAQVGLANEAADEVRHWALYADESKLADVACDLAGLAWARFPGGGLDARKERNLAGGIAAGLIGKLRADGTRKGDVARVLDLITTISVHCARLGNGDAAGLELADWLDELGALAHGSCDLSPTGCADHGIVADGGIFWVEFWWTDAAIDWGWVDAPADYNPEGRITTLTWDGTASTVIGDRRYKFSRGDLEAELATVAGYAERDGHGTIDTDAALAAWAAGDLDALAYSDNDGLLEEGGAGDYALRVLMHDGAWWA